MINKPTFDQKYQAHPVAIPADWPALRRRFPAAAGCTYLNTASRGLLPDVALAAGSGYYQVMHDDAGAGLSNHWLPHLQIAREIVAAFIGASPTSLAFVANASAGMNLGADMIGEAGTVLAHAHEFPSVTLPWIQRGHEVCFIEPAQDGTVSTDDYARAITADTRYIAVSAVQYTSGYLVDLRALRALCDEHNLYLLVDATQAVGTLPVDVRHFAPDVMTFSSYKWLCAGYGVAALYVSPQLLDSKPLPAVGWRSAENAYGLANHDATLSTEAYALELGNPVMPGPLVLGASVALLAQVGVDAIGQRIGELTARLHDGLDVRGIAIRTPRDPARRAGITMLAVADAAKAEKNLGSRHIHVSARAGLIRVSPHFYNNEDDIDALLDALD